MSTRHSSGNRHSRTPAHRGVRSYDSSDDDYSDSDASYDSDSSEDEKPQKRRHSVQPTKYNAVAKATDKASKVAQRRRAMSDTEDKRHRRKYYDSDSSSEDSSDEDSDSSNSDGYSKHGDGKNDFTSYHKRPKTRLEKKVDSVLDALGLLHIKNDPSRRQLASPDPEKFAKQKQALQAAVTAAAIEAWRSHSKPGGFNLNKVLRVVIAAIAAGGVDVLLDNKPGHESTRDMAEAIVGGLATSKALGGKITHRREGGAQGKMIDGFIALAASKMVKPPKQEDLDRRKREMGQRSRSVEPSKKSKRSSDRR